MIVTSTPYCGAWCSSSHLSPSACWFRLAVPPRLSRAPHPLPLLAASCRLLCSFRGKYILDADISQEALAALPLAIPGASPGESHATSSRDASCVSITRDRGGDRGTAPLAAECACGCPRGCTCACCSRSSVQKQAACPALRKALLTREEEGSQGMGERQVVAVHLPPLEKWGTLSFEVRTPWPGSHGMLGSCHCRLLWGAPRSTRWCCACRDWTLCERLSCAAVLSSCAVLALDCPSAGGHSLGAHQRTLPPCRQPLRLLHSQG